MFEDILPNIIDSISYPVLFLLFVMEGPIVNFIASSFCAISSKLNIFAVFFLAVCGDTLGDIIYFYIGRTTSKKKKISKIISFSEVEKVYKKIKDNTFLFLFLSKLTSIGAVPGILLLGHKKTSSKKFIVYTIILAILFNFTISFLAYNFFLNLNDFVAYKKNLKLIVIILILGIFSIRVLKFIIHKYMNIRMKVDKK